MLNKFSVGDGESWTNVRIFPRKGWRLAQIGQFLRTNCDEVFGTMNNFAYSPTGYTCYTRGRVVIRADRFYVITHGYVDC